MKTAMQELIELIEKEETRLDLIENHKQIWLEKEKEQIIDDYENGKQNGIESITNVNKYIIGEEYYNQNYNKEVL